MQVFVVTPFKVATRLKVMFPGGITKGEEVANGIVQALGRVQIKSPIVIRLDGTNAEQGREILKGHESEKLVSRPTMLEAARNAVELAK